MTLSRVSPVQAFLARLRLTLLLAVLSSVTLLALPTFASAVVTPNANPDLASRCGLNVMVVLDESGSIDNTAGATAAVRSGAMAFVRSLKDTGSKVAMVEFNTNARKVFDYTTVTSTNAAENNSAGSTFYRYLYNDPTSVSPDYNPAEYNGTNAAGTNWEDALNQVKAANNGTGVWAGAPDADLVVFITDGNPTAWIDDGNGSTQVVGGTFSQTALDNAIPVANDVKSQGSHMFVVGVGDAVTDAVSASHIAAISGTDKYPSPTPSFSQGDYTLVTSFTALEAALKNIATQLCQSSVTVTKQVDESAGAGYVAANGWDFTGTVTADGPFTWVSPFPNPGASATVTTSGAGTSTFQWKATSAPITSAISITETQKTGYTVTGVDCIKNNVAMPAIPTSLTFSLTGLAPTDIVTCTVKNKRDTGTIELKKSWSGTPGQTTLNIGTSAGGTQIASQQTGANGGGTQSTGTKTVPTATYNLSETGGLADYDASLSCTRNGGQAFTPANDAVTVNKGDVVICTYTNTRKTGTIKLVKNLVGGGNDKFNLKLGGINQTTSPGGLTTFGNGDSTAVLTKETGTYTVTEAAVAPALDSDYTRMLSCINNGTGAPDTDGSVVIAKGDNWVCTFTNTRNSGTIELKKVWSGTGGQTTLNIGTSAGGTQVATQQTGAAGAAPLTTGVKTVNTGNYFLSETGGLADYDQALSCINKGTGPADTDGAITVASGDSWVCTYTNTRQTGTVKLVKNLVGGGSDKFNLKLDGVNQTTSPGGLTTFGNGDSTAILTKDTGTYTVTEAAVAPALDSDYTRTLSCINKGTGPADTDGTITIAKGDNWVCTFTNTRDQGSIELKKTWSGTAGQTTLNIGTSAGGTQVATQQTGAAGAAPLTTGAKTVNTGTYNLSETGGLTDYDSALSCTRNGGQAFTPANDAVVVNKSDVVVCTYTNTRKTGTIKLVKQLNGGGSDKFNLKLDNVSQTRSSGGTAFGDGDATNVLTKDTGTYSVTEAAVAPATDAQYSESLSCINNNQGSPDTDGSVVIAKGDNWVCTFTNTRLQGSIELKKVWSGTGGQTTLKIGTSAGGSQVATQQTGTAGAGPLTTGANTVNTGTYYLSESGGLTNYNSSLSCTRNGGQAFTPANDAVAVNATDAVVCTYTNTRKTGTVKLVKHLNGGGSDKFNLKLDNVNQTRSSGGTAFGDGDETNVLTKDTGTYSVTEAAVAPATDAQYDEALSCINKGQGAADTDGTIAVAEGDAWVCTFTNTRLQGSIELKKVWSGTGGQTTLKIGTSAGGSQVATQQTGAAGAGPLTTGSSAVNTGTYYLSEAGGLEDYDSALSCTRNGGQAFTPANDAVVVNATDAVICTYTNTRKTGTIKLVKQLNGGGSDKFNLKLNNVNQTRSSSGTAFGDGDATNVLTKDTGTYSVTEAAVAPATDAQYSESLSCINNNQGSPDTDGSVVIAKGDNWVCTFTNTRKTGTVKLVKQLNGGGSDKFNLKLDNVSQTRSSGGTAFGDGDATSVLTKDTGTYSVTEAAVAPATDAQYDESLSCVNGNAAPDTDGSIVIAEGDDWVCTFTNTRRTGTIKLVKNLIGGNGDTFNLKLNAVNQSKSGGGTAFADGDATAVLTKDTGTYTVSEDAIAPAADGDYVELLSCINNGTGSADTDGSVVIAKGDNWVCTFTNTRKTGTVKLIKKLNGGGSDTFNLKLGGVSQAKSGGGTAFGNNDATDTLVKDTGTYSVTEAAVSPALDSQYTESLSCVNGTAPADTDGSIDIGPGDEWVCTFTNTRKQGSIELKKSWKGTAGQTTLKIGTSAGGAQVDSQQTGAAGAAPLTTGENTVDTGTYFLSESGGLSDYTQSLSCTRNGGDAFEPEASGITVGYQDKVVCTFTNTRKQGTIELKKSWSGTAGQTTLKIGTSAGGAQVDEQETGAAGAAPLTTGANDVDTGTYFVSESGGLANYTQSLSCRDKDGAVTVGTDNAVAVGEGDQIVCTFTNTRKQGSIELKKTWVGTPGQTKLSIKPEAGGDPVDEQLTGAGGAAPQTTGKNTVDTGDYVVSESTGLSNYTASLSCERDGTSFTVTDGKVSVGSGDEVVCTFTNTRKTGTIELKKAWSGTPGQTTLNIGTDAGGSQVDSQQTGAAGAAPLSTGPNTVETGTYYVSESGGLANYDASLVCDDGEETFPVQDGAVVVGAGDQIVCTFTNTRQTGKVTLVKKLQGGGSDRFNLKLNGEKQDVSTGGQAFGNNDETKQLTVDTGSYSVTESAISPAVDSDYDESVSCVNNAGEERVVGRAAAVAESDPGTFTVRQGDDWVCTFTNIKKARITIKKTVSNPVDGAGPSFPFTTSLPETPASDGIQPIVAGEPNTFQLKHTQKTQVQVFGGEGVYRVTEGATDGIEPGYVLTNITCTDADGSPVTERSFGEGNDVSSAFKKGDRTVSIAVAPGADVTCTYTNKRIVGLQVVVKGPKSQGVYADGTATYTYAVTNTGTSDLTDIVIGDDKCSPISAPNTGADATPTVLNPGETWNYTCSVPASTLFAGGATAPVTNTVTVTGKDELGRTTPASKDTAVTNLLVPGVALAKTVAPASQNAKAGDAITFNITVTNTGNTSLTTVNVSDDLCPSNLSAADKTGDGSPATLDPGESWGFTCVVQTTAAQAGTTIVNTAGVTGTDTGGKTVTANGNASQSLPAPVIGQSITGKARIASASAGCVKSAYGTASVTGSNIKQVTFYVNGKMFSRLSKPNSGKNYRMQLKTKGLKYGTYKITAKVVFVSGASPSSKTLNVQFNRCRPRVVTQPKFTG